MKTTTKQLGMIILGAAIYAVAINYFLIPNRIGEGGVTGLTTIGYYALNIPPAWTNLTLNGILVLVGFYFLPKRIVWYSLWAVAWISLFLRLPVTFAYHTQQTLVPSIIGGVLMGLAMGVILRAHGTIAGSTILAKIVNRFFGIKNGTATLMFDLVVAIPSGLVIGFENMLLTVVELYISAVVLNQFLDRFGAKQVLWIMSSQAEAIAARLSETFKHGVTLVAGTGVHGQQEQPLVYVVLTNQEWAQALPLVQQLDEAAVVVSQPGRSVRGNQLHELL